MKELVALEVLLHSPPPLSITVKSSYCSLHRFLTSLISDKPPERGRLSLYFLICTEHSSGSRRDHVNQNIKVRAADTHSFPVSSPTELKSSGRGSPPLSERPALTCPPQSARCRWDLTPHWRRRERTGFEFNGESRGQGSQAADPAPQRRGAGRAEPGAARDAPSGRRRQRRAPRQLPAGGARPAPPLAYLRSPAAARRR